MGKILVIISLYFGLSPKSFTMKNSSEILSFREVRTLF